ncbi:MAG: hypothetical protein AB7R40_23775 [Nitrospiraceae bacterium]
MTNGKKKPNKRDQLRMRAATAMPEVKKLVAKYGRVAVANCLNKIKARDKEANKLAAMKREVEKLERALR